MHALLNLVDVSGSHDAAKVESACFGGRVLLFGVDVSTLPVDELRRRVAVCPQDCVLFRGTLRQGCPGGDIAARNCTLAATRLQ